MWGHAYVESIDAFVLYIISLCLVMYHMDFIDAVSCMISLIKVICLNEESRLCTHGVICP